MKITIYVTLISIFLSCCNRQNNYISQVEYYPNGDIKNIKLIDKNDNSILYLTEYGLNGKLSRTYLSDQKSNVQTDISFFDNRNIKSLYNSSNYDTVNQGISYKFFEDGKIYALSNQVDTFVSGEQLIYANNGLLERCSFFVKNNQIFLKKYDPKGRALEIKGSAVYNFEILDSIVRIKTIVPPPNTKILIELYSKNKGTNKFIERKEKTITEFNIRDNNKDTLILKVKLIDLDTEYVLEDNFEIPPAN